MKQQYGRSMNNIMLTLMMSLIIGISNESCTSTTAKANETPFNAEGKVKKVNHADSSIIVDTSQNSSIKNLLKIYPVSTENVKIGDSAKIKIGKTLSNGIKVADTLAFFPKKVLSSHKKDKHSKK